MTSTTRGSGTSFHILRRSSGGNFGKSSNFGCSSGIVAGPATERDVEEVGSVILGASRKQVNVPSGLEDWKTVSWG